MHNNGCSPVMTSYKYNNREKTKKTELTVGPAHCNKVWKVQTNLGKTYKKNLHTHTHYGQSNSFFQVKVAGAWCLVNQDGRWPISIKDPF